MTDELTDGTARPTRRLRVALGSLAVVVVALGVAAIVLALELSRAKALDEAREDAVQAARQEALNLTSIDNEDLEADLKRVLDGATGEFREDFSQRAEQLRGILRQNQVVSQGRVIEAAVVRSDEDTATVLVVVDGTVKNVAIPQGAPRNYRMQLDLEKHDGRWLTSSLQFVG